MNSVDYLKPLIEFPSVSSTSNSDVSRWVEEKLKRLGCETEWLAYTDENGIEKVCVSGRIGPLESAERGMAYFCHTDVVPATTWSFPASGPWEPTEQDGKLYGRGSCDMKGSLACALAALELRKDQQLSAPLYIVATADEEIGLMGAREVAARSDFYREMVRRQSRAIIGEPTLLSVVHAHKGGCGMEITADGIAAHSSTDKGVNANFAMIPFLAEAQQIYEEIHEDAAWQDDRFVPPTISLNLTVNDNNHAMNITPARSVCQIYFRIMPKIDGAGLEKQFHDLAAKHGLKSRTVFVTDPLFTDPDSEFIQELLELSGTSKSSTVAYGTDGAAFSELNDIAVFGPGDIRQAHTDDEWISLEQLDKGTDVFGALIDRWCKPS